MIDSAEQQSIEQQAFYEERLKAALSELENERRLSREFANLSESSQQQIKSLREQAAAADRAHRDELRAVWWRWLLVTAAATVVALVAGLLLG